VRIRQGGRFRKMTHQWGFDEGLLDRGLHRGLLNRGLINRGLLNRGLLNRGLLNRGRNRGLHRGLNRARNRTCAGEPTRGGGVAARWGAGLLARPRTAAPATAAVIAGSFPPFPPRGPGGPPPSRLFSPSPPAGGGAAARVKMGCTTCDGSCPRARPDIVMAVAAACTTWDAAAPWARARSATASRRITSRRETSAGGMATTCAAGMEG